MPLSGLTLRSNLAAHLGAAGLAPVPVENRDWWFKLLDGLHRSHLGGTAATFGMHWRYEQQPVQHDRDTVLPIDDCDLARAFKRFRRGEIALGPLEWADITTDEGGRVIVVVEPSGSDRILSIYAQSVTAVAIVERVASRMGLLFEEAGLSRFLPPMSSGVNSFCFMA